MSKTETIVRTLTELAEPACARVGVELVVIRLATENGEKVARIIIDRERTDGLPGSAISLEDCQSVSRDIGHVLDEQPDLVPGAFRLEVSSPGLERPLVKVEDYERFAGREVRIKTFEPIEKQRSFEGKLLGITDGSVRIESQGRVVLVPLSGVAKAHLVHRFS